MEKTTDDLQSDAPDEARDTDRAPEDIDPGQTNAPLEATLPDVAADEPVVVLPEEEPEAAASEGEPPEAIESDDAVTSTDIGVEQEEIAAPEDAAVVEQEVAGEEQEVAGEEQEDEDLLWVPGEWYVVHTYAGYENKVKTNLESRIASMNMEEKIYEVVIPTEDVMEVKSGKKQVVQRKVFPGYLLVRLDLDDDSWYVVRNTPGVTGFVGSASKPIPLSQREVDRVLQRKVADERPKPQLEFSVSDAVRVVAGPFANFQGIISDIDADRSKLKVLVNIFGRETPVELGFDQVAKV